MCASMSGNRELDMARAASVGERQLVEAAQRSLRGQVRGVRALMPFLGPAFVAAVAYVDPGNFAANLTSGATFGYTLVWVVLTANLMTMLIQTLSARLGIATGRNLPEVCRDRFPLPVVWLLWGQAELVAMVTDLAELIGAALGLNLVFGIPLFPAALITGVTSFLILGLRSRGTRSFEAMVAGLVGIIILAFTFQLILARPSWPDVAQGMLVPRFDGAESVLLAASVLGATVMPHAIYLHSALVDRRVVGMDAAQRRRIYQFERWDVILAMTIAGAINMSMMVIAAAAFFGHTGIDAGNLSGLAGALGSTLGFHANLVFGIALLASGLSSSSVGTLSGQVVMQGFIHYRIPVLIRRAITMLPALAIIAIGFSPSAALVLSQVVLSFGIPFALIPLIMHCRNPEVMGTMVTGGVMNAISYGVVALIIGLNVILIYQTLRG
jgi:manganese transport protein